MADTIKLQKSEEEKAREASTTGDTIDLRAKVTVYSTDKDPHHKTGTAIKCHPKLAQDLAKNGFVSAEPTEAKNDQYKGGDTAEIAKAAESKEDIDL